MRRKTLTAAFLLVGLVLPASDASARKLGNSGTSTSFTATVTNGSSIKVGSQEFGLTESDPVTISGTVNNTTGAVSVPASGVDFPTLEAGGYPVHINVVDTVTGTLNPFTGSLVMNNLKVWIKIDDVPFGGGCRIASAGSPIVVSPLTSASSGSVTGTPYNPANGEGRVVNGTFEVPGSSDCGIAGGTVDSTVGIPSAAGNNNAQFNLRFNPILTKGVNASFTVTPSTGTVPFTPTFNGSGSTCIASPCQYRWDFDGNGTVDQTTTTPTTSTTFNYTVAGAYTPRLTVVDADNDSDTTTRSVQANLPPPDLTIDKSHSGNFLAASNQAYTLSVSNSGAGNTVGTTTVTDTLPAGLTYVSATGTGWSCNAAAQVVTCTRTGAINSGGTAPAITLTTAVAPSAPADLTNSASVATPTEVNTANNSDSDFTTIDRVDVGIVKSHGADFSTGTVETWELEVSSSGTVATTGVTTVTDTLPGGVTYVGAAAPAGWSCGAAGQLVTCTRDAGFAAGTSEIIELDVTAGTIAVPSVTNTAAVSTPNDSSSANDSSSDPTTVNATVDLTIDKSHTGSFRVGSPGTYTIAVQNRGARATSGTTTVTDTLPAGLTPDSATGTGWSCGISGQDVTCTDSTVLGAGANAELITIGVSVDASALPSVSNTASVSTSGTGQDVDVNPANDADTDPTTITATDLTIDKSHVGGFPIGGQGDYTLTVRNVGGAATSGTTTVTDTLPAELGYVNAAGTGWTCGAVGQDVTCTRTDSVGAGDNAPAITLTVSIDADETAEETTNAASVDGADDVNAANDSDSDLTPLTAADLTIAKSHTGDFRVGATRAYVLRVSNVGSQPATGTTTVTDTLPDGLTYVDGTGSGWSCSATGQDVTCTRAAPVAAGANAPSITVQVGVGLEAYPSVTNSAAVANGDDRNDANDSATDPTTVVAPDLELTKGHLGALQVNDRASYAIDVENVGTAATASTATVTDTLPAGLTYVGVAASSSGWSCSAAAQVVTCDHDGSIAVGASAQTLELLADIDASAAEQVTNTASVAHGDDPVSANDSDDDTADVGRIDLSIDKSHTGDLPRGGTGAFTLAVDNEGTDPTQGNTRVTDTLPAGLSYAGATGTGWSCSVSAGVVTCDHAGSIAANSSAAEITLQVDVDETAPAQVTNTASVATGDDADPSDDSDSDQADVAVGADAAVSIRPQVSPGGSFRVGTNGTYTATVRNTGAGVISGPVTATLALPAGLGYVSGTGTGWSCGAAGQDVTCTRAGGLAAAERSDIAVEVDVAKPAVPGVVTPVSLTAPGDSVSSNNSAQAPTDVTMIDLAISMQHAGSFAVGAVSTFTIGVENVGSAATLGTTRVTDTLPSGLAPGSASGTGWTCSTSGQTVTCILPPGLAAGAQAPTLTIPVTPAAGIGGSGISNTATVFTSDDAEAANNTATDGATVGPAPATSGVAGTNTTAPAPAAPTCKPKKGKKGKKKAKKCGKKKKKKK